MKRIFGAIIFLFVSHVVSATGSQGNQVDLNQLLEFDLFQLSQVTVSVASGFEQLLAKAPSVVTIITANDIENMGARDLDEVLSAVPGLHVSYLRTRQIYTMRGISTSSNSEVLVLVNGIRLNNAQTGGFGFLWSGLPVNSIARIEVIRGPGAAIYGADAFAGVINIITKQVDDIEGTEVGTRIGQFNTRDGWLLHGKNWHNFAVVAMFEYNQTDGHDEIIEADNQTRWDNVFGTDASHAPGAFNGDRQTYNLILDLSHDKWRLRMGGHLGRDNGMGVGAVDALDPNGYFDDERFNADLTYQDKQLVENWELTAQLHYLHRAFDGNYYLYPPGAFGGLFPVGQINQITAAERRSGMTLAGIYSGMDKHLIRLGAGYAYEDLYETTDKRNYGLDPVTGEFVPPTLTLTDFTETDVAYSPEASRESWYVFAHDTWTLNSTWQLTTGIRYDNYSDFGSVTNPRLGLVWSVTPSLATKLLYGRVFRAPAFNETTVDGDKLEPETLQSWELVFDYRTTKDFYSTLNLFTYKIEDKISPVITQRPFTREWKGQGLELEMSWFFSRFSRLTFNYAYQNSEDSTEDSPLATAPNHQAYLHADWAFWQLWSVHGQVHWAADWENIVTETTVASPTIKVDDYLTLDLMLRRKDSLGSHTSFSFGVRNILDEDVLFPTEAELIPHGYPQAGRNFFAEFRYYF